MGHRPLLANPVDRVIPTHKKQLFAQQNAAFLMQAALDFMLCALFSAQKSRSPFKSGHGFLLRYVMPKSPPGNYPPREKYPPQ